MILTATEYNAYLNVHLDLLYFTGKRSSILKAETSFKEFKELPLKKKFECRQLFHDFPVLIKTTILPFNGKIIYDGFLETWAYLGPNMTREYNEIYMETKKNRHIITSLDPPNNIDSHL